jgi:hypothetical protein
MHAVARIYDGKGAHELFDVLERRKSDVESLIRSIKGFVSFSLVRAADGGFSPQMVAFPYLSFQDKVGVDESG